MGSECGVVLLIHFTTAVRYFAMLYGAVGSRSGRSQDLSLFGHHIATILNIRDTRNG